MLPPEMFKALDQDAEFVRMSNISRNQATQPKATDSFSRLIEYGFLSDRSSTFRMPGLVIDSRRCQSSAFEDESVRTTSRKALDGTLQINNGRISNRKGLSFGDLLDTTLRSRAMGQLLPNEGADILSCRELLQEG
jgi:hypothetical protein